MKSAAIFAAAFVLSCVVFESAETSASTKIRRYSSFYCSSNASIVDNTYGRGIKGPQGTRAYCPHVGSNDFALDEVNAVTVSMFADNSTGSFVPGAKVCTSWASEAEGSYSYSCGYTSYQAVPPDSNVIELNLDDDYNGLSSWHDHPAWYAYIVVDFGGGGQSGVVNSVVGYKIAN